MNNLPPNISNLDIEEQQDDELPDEMTPEAAIVRLRIIADLGNLPASAKQQLRLIADWIERKIDTK